MKLRIDGRFNTCDCSINLNFTHLLIEVWLSDFIYWKIAILFIVALSDYATLFGDLWSFCFYFILIENRAINWAKITILITILNHSSKLYGKHHQSSISSSLKSTNYNIKCYKEMPFEVFCFSRIISPMKGFVSFT